MITLAPFLSRFVPSLLFISAILLSPCASFSQADEFATAVAAFKAGKLSDARDGFLKIDSQYPSDPIVLLNLGLIAQKEKRAGAALALWRKGLAAHPTDPALQNAVDWLKPKLPKAEIAHDIDAWEEFRRLFLLRVSPSQIVMASAVFLFFAGALLLRWWGARRRSIDEDLASPPAPIGGVVMSVLALFLVAVSIAFFIDRLDIRGTIVSSKVDVRSAPDIAATSLFEAFEGMEVVILEARKVGDEAWRRINYPGGLSGWVRDRDVMTSADPSDRAFPAPTTTPGEKP